MFKPVGNPYLARCFMGLANHQGVPHIVAGWNGVSAQDAVDFNDVVRMTDDTMLNAESTPGVGLVSVGFCDLVSLGGHLILSPGYDGSHPPTLTPNDDQVNDFFQASGDGGLSWSALPALGVSPTEHAAFALGPNGACYWGGLRYNVPQTSPITYTMSRKSFRINPDLSVEMRSADLGYQRRGMMAKHFRGGFVCYGGIDDTLGTTANKNDVHRSEDDLATLTKVADGIEAGSLRAAACEVFTLGGEERFFLIGGAWYGGLTSAVWSSASQTLAAGTWTRHADFPYAAQGMKAVSTMVDGAPAVVVVGGQPAGGGAIGKIHYTRDFESWTALPVSALWTAQ